MIDKNVYLNPSQEKVSYTYDNLNRLIKEEYSNYYKPIEYTYDSIGNRIKKKDETGSEYTYNYNKDRLTAIKKDWNDKYAIFSYDNNGNLINIDNFTSQDYNYIYNYTNQLIKESFGNKEFIYDGFGRKGKQRQSGSELLAKTYIYDGLNVLMRFEKSRVIEGGQEYWYEYLDKEYLFVNGKPLARYNFNKDGNIFSTSYYYYDGLGSVVNVPYIEWSHYRYNAFGEVRQKKESVSENDFWLFTGKSYDLSLGLYNFGARYYDAKTGRFITKDPYLGNEMNPQQRHRYAYCANNPVNYVDPYGYWAMEVIRGHLEKRMDWQVEQGNTLPVYINAIGLAMLPESDKGAAFEVGLGIIAGPVTSKVGGRLGGEVLRPIVTHPKLKNIIDYLYRPGAKIGAGSTADAIRYEKATGHLLSPKGHIQKGQGAVKALQKWLKANPNVSSADKASAQFVLDDLLNALKGD